MKLVNLDNSNALKNIDFPKTVNKLSHVNNVNGKECTNFHEEKTLSNKKKHHFTDNNDTTDSMNISIDLMIHHFTFFETLFEMELVNLIKFIN